MAGAVPRTPLALPVAPHDSVQANNGFLNPLFELRAEVPPPGAPCRQDPAHLLYFHYISQYLCKLVFFHPPYLAA